MFWLYMFDIQNLDMMGMASTEPNPMSQYRWDNLAITPINFRNLPTKFYLEEAESSLSTLTINTKAELPEKCDMCPAAYKNKQELKRHKIKQHGVQFNNECEECGSNIEDFKITETAYFKNTPNLW